MAGLTRSARTMRDDVTSCGDGMGADGPPAGDLGRDRGRGFDGTLEHLGGARA
jgi:hypothetical protein